MITKVAISEMNSNVELDSDQQVAWLLADGSSTPKFGMIYSQGKWGPSQGALLLAGSLEEVTRVMDWLQANYPKGAPQ